MRRLLPAVISAIAAAAADAHTLPADEDLPLQLGHQLLGLHHLPLTLLLAGAGIATVGYCLRRRRSR